jgi:hypothetical protein
MIPQAVQLTLPLWAQAILAIAAILANLATFAFVLFVLWPSIRNQERRAQKLEDWMQTAEYEKLRRAVISKIDKADGLDAAGKPVDKKSWWDSQTEDGDRSGL